MKTSEKEIKSKNWMLQLEGAQKSEAQRKKMLSEKKQAQIREFQIKQEQQRQVQHKEEQRCKIEEEFKMPAKVAGRDIWPLQQLYKKMKESIKSQGDGKRTRADFENKGVLGEGGFGRVYRVQDVQCQLTFALKVMDKSELVEKKCELQVVREIEIQSHLR